MKREAKLPLLNTSTILRVLIITSPPSKLLMHHKECAEIGRLKIDRKVFDSSPRSVNENCFLLSRLHVINNFL